ncbi:hypothetical protein KUTeg_016676 [Tegillarca granosa]|uniref:ceramide glucosyltransferase n=1 Tax=Tegillarca granosa TaxID=220873 RepID=A0ABQ9EQF2_TEGGR|nr:hypothetical protein KUTeg_016676 [Tegillarca granosa]
MQLSLMFGPLGDTVKEDTITDMVQVMTEKVGLVQQMPYAATRRGFASHMEKVIYNQDIMLLDQIYFGTQHAKMYVCANVIGINCATGMSCLMRKPVIEEAGGLIKFTQYLAEDYFLAQEFINRGWHIKLSSQPALQHSGTYSITTLHNRLTRWCKLRTAMTPLTVFFEPISLCFPFGIIASWSISFLFNWTASVVFLVHALVWFLMDYVLINIIEGGTLPFSKFEFVVAWLFNELTYIGIIMRSHWNSTIVWRNRHFKLRWGGVVEELHVKQTV